MRPTQNFLILLLLVLLIQLLQGCTCKEISDLSLTEYQQTLIPYQSADVLIFEDQNKQSIQAQVTAKIRDDFSYVESESCDPAIAERELASLRIPAIDRSFEIRVNARIPTFEIAFENSVYWPSCPYDEVLEENLTDVTVDGYVYQDVFQFAFCAFIDSEIEFILYSPTNGVEFIKFEDGTYLRLLL